MDKFRKLIEILLSLEIIIISSMIPVFISIPSSKNIIQSYEMPITWQITSIITITLIFKAEIVYKAFTLYLILGIFFLPVFHNGGSLGYILTPNFGYLLGIYPLIKIISNLNKKVRNIDYFSFIRSGILGIISMHLTGIIYSIIQIIYFIQADIVLYNFSSYSLGKIGYHLLMLAPVTLIVKPLNKYRYQK